VPSGIVHAKSSLILSVPAFALAYGASHGQPGQVASGAACALGCLLGIVLTPDLDQEGLSSSEYALVKWTMGLGFVWVMLWYPYARLCKHRSPLSHWPLLGTLGRLLYLGLWGGIALYFGWKPPLLPPMIFSWSVVGLLISDTAHWIMDMKFGDRSSKRH
jgi:uncharacterized metal-binding protein